MRAIPVFYNMKISELVKDARWNQQKLRIIRNYFGNIDIDVITEMLIKRFPDTEFYDLDCDECLKYLKHELPEYFV